jgi:hypothetical protein
MAGRIFGLLAGAAFLLATAARADGPPAPFGPAEYVRTAGAPNLFTVTFPVRCLDGPFRLRVENGPGGQARLSSASLWLNGTEVVRPRDLNPRIGLVERPVGLRPHNTLLVRLAGPPGGTLRVSVVAATPCLRIALTGPAPGAEVPAGLLLVRGTVEGPPDVGVAVNGTPALVADGVFAALVPVEPGTDTLTAVAATPGGVTAEARQALLVVPGATDTVRLRVSPRGGEAPLTVGFALASLVGVTEVSLDAMGTGGLEGPRTSIDGSTATYVTPGLYAPRVEVLDLDGRRHTATALVLVHDRAALDARLQAVWRDMRDALRAGDIGRALGFVHSDARAGFEADWRRLPAAVWAGIDRYLTSIQLVDVGAGGAQYEMLRERDGQLLSFAVWFQMDHDGLWRLRRF